MKLFNKPLSVYLQFAKTGIYLLALVSVIRFLMQPVFNIPYAQGTHFTSVTILMILLMIYYAFRANAAGYDYRDLLGIATALAWPTTVMIILGIAIDEFGGIDTYYTDPAHSGSPNPWLHIGGHVLVSGIITPLVLWGIGALIYYAASASRKKATA
jgi:hypothetical protein